MDAYKILHKNNATILLSAQVVIKVYKNTENSMRDFENELRIWEWLARSSVDNLIVPFIDSCEIPDKYIENELLCWQNGGRTFGALIVNNLLPLNDIGNIREDIEENIVMGILNGVKLLHFEGFIHGDLKPDNILLDRDYRPKIADFGMTIHESEDLNPLQKYVTPILRSSEHLSVYSELHPTPDEYDGKKLDIWSIGISLIWMLAYKYDSDRILDVIDAASNGNTHKAWILLFGKLPTEHNYCHISDNYCLSTTRNIIEKCLIFKHIDRPSIMDLI